MEIVDTTSEGSFHYGEQSVCSVTNNPNASDASRMRRESFVMDKEEMQKIFMSKARRGRKQKKSIATRSKNSDLESTVSNDSDQKEKPTTRDLLLSIVDGTGTDSTVVNNISTTVTIIVFLTILLSVVVFCMETMPRYDSDNAAKTIFEHVEYYCIAVFTLEYLSRFALTYDKKSFVTDFFNTIDLLAILPFYIKLTMVVAGSSSSFSLVFLRALRLVRVLRVFKIGQYSKTVWVVFYALSVSLQSVTLLFVLFFVATILFSSVLFMAEQTGSHFDEPTRTWIRDDGTESPFSSIPATFWFTVVTLTTVGYGDQVPFTILGKLVTSLCIVTGTLLLSFPVLMISQNFRTAMEIYEETQQNVDEDLGATVIANPLIPPSKDAIFLFDGEFKQVTVQGIIGTYPPLLSVVDFQVDRLKEHPDMEQDFAVSFGVVLDSFEARDEACSQCRDGLCSVEYYSAQCVESLCFSITGLPASSWVLYPQVTRPPDAFRIVICSDSLSAQTDLIASLHSLSLVVACTVQNSPNTTKSVPLRGLLADQDTRPAAGHGKNGGFDNIQSPKSPWKLTSPRSLASYAGVESPSKNKDNVC